MRAAEIRGRLIALRNRPNDKGPRLRGLEVESLRAFDNVALELDNAFLAVCGGTGTGKSTLLLAIYAGLKPLRLGSEEFRTQGVARFKIKVSVSGPAGNFAEERNFTAEPVDAGGYPGKVFLETIDDRTEVWRRSAVGDVQALKEGVEGFELDSDALTFLRIICRKNYRSVRVYETELDDDRYYPHFEVKEGNAEYSSEDMGSGEHSAFYLAWRLSTAPANSVVLLEEPEALLPPAAHEQICAMISLFAQKRSLLPIFTTHSSGIVDFLGDGDVISLSRLAGATSLPTSTEAKASVLSKLGLLPPKPLLALAEDDVGVCVLQELLDQFGFPDVLDVSVVKVLEGAGGIKTVLDLLSNEGEVSGVFGFLDGDMKTEAGKWTCKPRLLFLPLTKAPEIEFLTALEEDPETFAERSDRPLARVRRSLEQSEGQDHHDRFRQVAADLGFEVSAFTRLAFNHYLRVRGKQDLAKEFARDLAGRARVSPPYLD